MLTKLIVRNFKRFEEVDIELGSPVVFIGPNNSGKTSAMQALALWNIGLKRWNEKRGGKDASAKRPGVTINRRDLIAVPVPDANLLWRALHVRDVRKIAGRQETSNIRIEIVVDGVTAGRRWSCGLEFDYANEESFYCRPLRLSENGNERMPIPVEAGTVQIAFLPPMSGLASNETRLDPGAVNVRIGEGRTAEVLRNLCHAIHEESAEDWERLADQIRDLFGCELDPPRYVPERGEIAMTYREAGVALDLSASGRGLQQTLLLLAYLNANPGAVLLLDEPDAHLEVLRQRQIYALISEVARTNESQVIAASHSEVLLNEAAGRDLVIAFVGQPHRIDGRTSQVMKALREIGFEQYYLAEQTGWVLYLEGSTDLAVLQAFARRLGHDPAIRALERPFVHYVANQPAVASKHFHALREAVPHLRGVAIFDHLESGEPDLAPIRTLMWRWREIENYFCTRETLDAYARAGAEANHPGPLFTAAEAEKRAAAMREAIQEVEHALQTLDKGSPWDANTKVSDDFLDPVFRKYFQGLGLYNLMAKKNFYELAEHIPVDSIDPEVTEKLDAIADEAEKAAER
jgi:ABC-type branched-subunit amino acid transport system ATPase component